MCIFIYFSGFCDFAAGLSVGFCGLAAGFAIGIVGDAGVRGQFKIDCYGRDMDHNINRMIKSKAEILILIKLRKAQNKTQQFPLETFD